MYEINVPNTETISSCSSFLVLWSICLTWIIFNLLWLEAISCNVYYQRNTLTDPWAVADPRFPRRGAPTPEFRVKAYYLTRFLLKTAWKWKKLDVGMCFPSAPLGSANGEGGSGDESWLPSHFFRTYCSEMRHQNSNTSEYTIPSEPLRALTSSWSPDYLASLHWCN